MLVRYYSIIFPCILIVLYWLYILVNAMISYSVGDLIPNGVLDNIAGVDSGIFKSGIPPLVSLVLSGYFWCYRIRY